MQDGMNKNFKAHASNSKPTWIWYPGDFEVWLGNIFNNRRTERGAMFPPFWKQDSHWPTVEFTTTVDLKRDENILITTEGKYNLAVDGKLQTSISIPKGRHRLSIKVWNQATPPALFVSGPTIHTDASWQTTYEDKIWIDENGTAHGSGIYVPVGSWNFNDPNTPPSQYQLERKELRPVSSERIDSCRTLYDFGREVFGYLRLSNQEGNLEVFYGESREEALDRSTARHLPTSIPATASQTARHSAMSAWSVSMPWAHGTTMSPCSTSMRHRTSATAVHSVVLTIY